MKIENTSSINNSTIKIVVAAEAGNGKTTLAKTIQETLKENVLVISAEAGLLSLRGSGVDYLELQKDYDEKSKSYVHIPKDQRITQLNKVFQYVSSDEAKSKYQWLFIDSLTEINQNMMELIESQEEFQGPKNTIKKFGELANRMRSLCKAFRDLPHYNVVFSALVKEDTDPDGKKFMKVDMTGKFADVLPSLFDEIFYLGVMPDVGEDGRNLRAILTQKTDKILFPKDRSGRLSRIEPADLGLIVKKIRGDQKPKPNESALISDISAEAKNAALAAKQNKEQL